VAVNQGPSLRRVAVASKPKQGAGNEQVELQTRKGKSAERAKTKSEARDKKRKSEAVRRDAERCQPERVCLLSKAPRTGWTRKEALSLGKKHPGQSVRNKASEANQRGRGTVSPRQLSSTFYTIPHGM